MIILLARVACVVQLLICIDAQMDMDMKGTALPLSDHVKKHLDDSQIVASYRFVQNPDDRHQYKFLNIFMY